MYTGISCNTIESDWCYFKISAEQMLRAVISRPIANWEEKISFYLYMNCTYIASIVLFLKAGDGGSKKI